MTSKTELKEMIEALREEIQGLRMEVVNLQTMVLNNQNKSTIMNIPFNPNPNGTGPHVPFYPTITCSTDTSKNDDKKIITTMN